MHCCKTTFVQLHRVENTPWYRGVFPPDTNVICTGWGLAPVQMGGDICTEQPNHLVHALLPAPTLVIF
jgi:hypothetical protein